MHRELHPKARLRAGLYLAVGLALMALPQISQAIELDQNVGSWGIHLGSAKARDAGGSEGLFGGQLEFDVAPWLGIQGAVDYHTQATVHVPITGNHTSELKIREIPATVSARVYLPMPNGLSPFLVGGAGWYRLAYDYSTALQTIGLRNQSHTDFGWHLGAGLRVPLAPRVSLYGEGRYVFLDPNKSLDAATREQIGDLHYNSSVIMGGLNFHF